MITKIRGLRSTASESIVGMNMVGFLSAYFSDWVGWMSGLFSVTLAIWGFIRPKADPKRRFIVTAAIVAFLVAPIHIWTIEHRARVAAESKLASNAPDLKIHVVEAIVGNYGNDVALVMTVTIRNLGTPSIADQWEVEIDTPRGRSASFRKELVRDDKGLDLEGFRHFSSRDAIYEKVDNVPIPQGGKQTGIIFYLVEGLSKEDLNADMKYLHVSVKDVTGRRVTSDGFNPNFSGPQFYPGISHP